MSLLLLKLFALLRPVLLLEFEQTIFGFGLFDLAAMAFLGVLFLSILVTMVVHKRFEWSTIDLLMFMYVLWCISAAFIYPDHTDFKDLLKWITPFLTWFAAKNVLNDRHDYLNVILLLMVGLGISIVVSSLFIFLGIEGALDKEIWATKQRIYEGAFADSHYLGQATTLFFFLAVIYTTLIKIKPNDHRYSLDGIKKSLFLIVTVAALHCMYYASVRTAMVGLAIFFGVYLYHINRKLLFLGVLSFLFIGIIYAASFEVIFYDIVQYSRGERALEKLGSGRPFIWLHNITEFSKVSLDRQMAGVGIGNKVPVHTVSYLVSDNFWPSHNDFLAVLIHTGIVGFLIFALLQFALLKKTLSLHGKEKYVFTALLLSVLAMTFATGSYVSYYGLAQIYYLAMSYIEIQSKTSTVSHSDNTKLS